MKSLVFKDKSIISSLFWRNLKWHSNYLFTKRPLPLGCNLYITNKCTFKCSFCNIWRKPNTTLPLSKAKKIIDCLGELGCFYFSIVGGEPLLVDYIFDLLRYARKNKIKYTHIVTNGYLLDEDKAVRLKDTGVKDVAISIDGTEQFHDKNRCKPGAYNKAIIAIENLKRHAPKIDIVLNAIFSPEDPLQCLHALDLARKFDVNVKIQPLNQHPIFNKDNYSLVSTDRSISKHQIKEVLTKLRKEPHVVNSKLFLDNIYNFIYKKEDLIFRDSPCIYGYHHIEIQENGDIFPCLEALKWQGGMQFNGNLKEILHSPEYKHLLEKLKTCRACQRNYYICYYEPRINFPINNFIRSILYR